MPFLAPSTSDAAIFANEVLVERAVGSAYVHFPWCLAKCPYCDFVSYATPRDAIDHVGYANAVLREIELRAEAMTARVRPFELGSIFFGGGTPSLWEPRELGRVLAALRERFACAPDLEVTVECNPTSLDGERARALADEGVTRLSIGTQALREDQLKYLGRLHDPAGATRAVTAAVETGLRVSTDLIFGLPTQTPEDARAQAEALADLGPAHLSCYQLTIEPGTAFGELARKGRLPLADDARVAEAFLAIDEALASRGFGHYEISNYARAGEEARHNLGYWRGEEYLGLGCAAFGFLREADATGGGGDGGASAALTGGKRRAGTRYRNMVDPKRYVDAEGLSGFTASREPLDAEALLRERIMLGLRLASGLDIDAAARDLELDPWTRDRVAEAGKLVDRGRLVREGGVLRIPRAEWLFTDDIAARLF